MIQYAPVRLGAVIFNVGYATLVLSVTGFGVKTAVTPFGKPPTLNVTGALNPPVGVRRTSHVPDELRRMINIELPIARSKPPRLVLLTVNVTTALRVSVGAVRFLAETIRLNVPGDIVPIVLIVSWLVMPPGVGVTALGLNCAVAPVGNPVIDKSTGTL